MMMVENWVEMRLTAIFATCLVYPSLSAHLHWPARQHYPPASEHKNSLKPNKKDTLTFISYDFLQLVRLCSNVQRLFLQMMTLFYSQNNYGLPPSHYLRIHVLVIAMTLYHLITSSVNIDAEITSHQQVGWVYLLLVHRVCHRASLQCAASHALSRKTSTTMEE